jgi:hypothetical protein
VPGSWTEKYEWDVFRLFRLEGIVWSHHRPITAIATADETFLFALTAERNLQIKVICVHLRAFQDPPGLISISRSMKQRRRSNPLLANRPRLVLRLLERLGIPIVFPLTMVFLISISAPNVTLSRIHRRALFGIEVTSVLGTARRNSHLRMNTGICTVPILVSISTKELTKSLPSLANYSPGWIENHVLWQTQISPQIQPD